MNDKYESLTDLGKRFGEEVTSHVAGRWLADAGLRTIGGGPTAKAFELGLVKKVPTGRGDGNGYFWVWHVAKTMAALKAAGHEAIQQTSEFDTPCKPLTGPFTFAVSGDGGLIQNRDGQTVFWSMDQGAAKTMTAVLQLAYRHRARFLDNDWEEEE